uniref:Reverse transcriptase domain-containing protein n=1 Tax=Tanacetum cinerariifolium TaxID=118510 RepID=A0A699L5Q0_TANCI|nr:hypothetical protein [Tanacetum cinerariifolium]
MSLSTISFDSTVESIRSSVSIVILSDSDAASAMTEAMVVASPAGVLDPALVVDSESEPFEDPSSLVDTADSDSDAKPLSSPTTSDYFARSDIKSDQRSFSRRTPRETIILMLLLGQISHRRLRLTHYYGTRTIQMPRKTVRPQPTLSPTLQAAIAQWVAASPSPSPPPLLSSPASLPTSSPPSSPLHSGPSCRRSRLPSPSSDSSHSSYTTPSSAAPAASLAPTLATVALVTPALPSIPVDLLPPSKRFRDGDRFESMEHEIETLRARLATVKREIAALQTMPTTRQGMSSNAIEQLIAQRVAGVLLTYEANKNSRNGPHQDTSGREGGIVHTARGCTCKEFLNCQPCNFKGTEGLLDWLDVGIDAAYEMSWKELMKMMTEVCCPRNENQKVESKLWNLTVKSNDVVGYTQRF